MAAVDIIISSLAELLSAGADGSDLITVVDSSEVGDARNKKMTLSEMVLFVAENITLDPAKYAPNVEVETGTIRVLTAADDGKLIYFSNAGAITVSVPTGMAKDWSVSLFRGVGAGVLTVQGDGTVVIEGPGASSTATTFDVGEGEPATVVEALGIGAGKALVFGGVS